jgi:dsRNA-specific ribonuclease
MQPLSSENLSESPAPSPIEETRLKELEKLQKDLRVKFRRIELFDQALSHSSFINEQPSQGRLHNEKLEFLGDAVLELVVSRELFNDYPQYCEGELTKLRAAIVRKNYKSILQEITQSRFQTLPKYTVLSEMGPPHDRMYKVSLSIAKEPYAVGSGRSKKEAQQRAARIALKKFKS